VTASFFPLLGVQPEVGRFFTPDEDRPHAAARVAVISDALWRGAFGGDPRTLGRDIAIGGNSYTVVGITPQGFTGADILPVDIWIPMSSAAAAAIGKEWDTTSGSFWLEIIARLRPHVSRARASAVSTLIYRRSETARDHKTDSLSIVEAGPLNVAFGPHQPSMDGRGRSMEISVSIWLAGVAVIVLLIACANVASLLSVRVIHRQREIAVRLALGAGRARLTFHLLAESVLLAVLGGMAGLALAYVGGRAVRTVLVPDVAWSGPPFNAHVLLFATAATLLTGLVTGLVPALSATDISLVKWLKDGARGGSSRTRASAVLLIAQTALSVVLLAGAGLFLRSLRNVQRVDLGMDTSHLMIVSADMRSGLLSGLELDQLLRTAKERLQRHAGVRSVSLSVTAPFSSLRGGSIAIPGRNVLPTLSSGVPYQNVVSPEFFTTLGSSFVSGRGFNRSEAGGNVLVVNETLARAYWPDQNPVGSCVYPSGSDSCAEIVGVVADIRQWRLVGEEPVGQFYTPLPAVSDSAASSAQTMFIRTTGDPRVLLPAIRQELVALSPKLAYLTVVEMDDMIAPQLRPWRLGATMFGAFGALALLIAAIGLHSVLAYAVARRTREIGVRMALGARVPNVTRLIVWSGLRTVFIGIGIGLLVVLVAGRIVAGTVYGVSPHDPLTLVVVSAIFATVAIIASTIPAWRAARVDPAIALRNSE
jgi:predicted permease